MTDEGLVLRNRAVVEELFRLAFEKRKPDEAMRLVSRTYREHSPTLGAGREAYAANLAELVGTYPFLQVSLKRLVAEGDHVVAHSHVVPEPGDRGRAVVEIFRLEQGKIVERWDVRQDVPARSENRNTMF